jgi:hypothetical protein
MIPVNQNTASDSTPTANTEQRVESQMKEEVKLGKPRVKLVKSIKKQKKSKKFNIKKQQEEEKEEEDSIK